jgi:peroxiredoxin
MPPVWMQVGIGVATLVGAGVFVARGIEDLGHSDVRLAEKLLDVRAVNRAPPPFELESMDGRRVRLADFEDRTVVINFWATWCPPCIEEFPSLRTMVEQFRDRPDFVFLAISTDETWEPVRRFFADAPPDFPVLLDPGGELARAYGTTKFPETYVVQRGQTVGHIVGPRTWDHWYARVYVDRWLQARPRQPARASVDADSRSARR